MFDCCFRDPYPPLLNPVDATPELVKKEPDFWEEVEKEQKAMTEAMEEFLKPVKDFLKPVGDAFVEYPILKVPVGFIAGCAYGVIKGEPVLIRGLYVACCVAGALASRYTVDHIGAAFKLKASTISLMHAISSALRTTIVLIAGVALEIFKSISPWALIGPTLSFIWSLKEAYDLKCGEMEAEAALAGAGVNS